MKQGKGEDAIISRVMFCNPSPADGYEPSDGTPDADAVAVYIALAHEDVKRAIAHLDAAGGASRVALDALRDALTAVEAEMEASRAQP